MISGAIDPQNYGLTLPGGNNEPGHRNIPAENHLLLGADNIDGISTIFYNFQHVIGVDLKQDGSRTAIIEVNDNPSIDAGVEDAYLGDDLYRRIMDEFLRRMERKRLGLRG